MRAGFVAQIHGKAHTQPDSCWCAVMACNGCALHHAINAAPSWCDDSGDLCVASHGCCHATSCPSNHQCPGVHGTLNTCRTHQTTGELSHSICNSFIVTVQQLSFVSAKQSACCLRLSCSAGNRLPDNFARHDDDMMFSINHHEMVTLLHLQPPSSCNLLEELQNGGCPTSMGPMQPCVVESFHLHWTALASRIMVTPGSPEWRPCAFIRYA
jgi:hypothetical protein